MTLGFQHDPSDFVFGVNLVADLDYFIRSPSFHFLNKIP